MSSHEDLFGDRDVGWQELDTGLYLACSSAFVLVFDVLLYPLELLRTRQQYDRSSVQNTRSLSVLSRIVRNEGVKGLWRGFPVSFAGSYPSQLVYFTLYEYLKSVFQGQTTKVSNGRQFAADMAAGFVADLASMAICVPFDIISQRMQVLTHKVDFYPDGRPQHSVTSELQRIVKIEGLRGFYRGFLASACGHGLGSAIWFATYVQSKNFMRSQQIRDLNGTAISMTSGSIAGAVSVVLTNPMDIARTRLQTYDNTNATEVAQVRRGFWHMLQTLYVEEGWRGLTRGLQPRLGMAIPSSAIAFTCYELAKRVASQGRVRSTSEPAATERYF